MELEKAQRVYAEIDMDAILHNVAEMKRHRRGNAKLIPVIKADGYGHGAEGIAQYLEEDDFIYGFCVATAEEAFSLRDAGVQKPILALSHVFPYANEDMINADVRFTIFRRDTIVSVNEAARRVGKKAKVHIKVETGMNRIGIRPDDEGLEFVKAVASCEWIEIEGIYTHFSKADETDKTYTEMQIRTFLDFVHRINSELNLEIPLKHCCNSAGIIRFPEAHMDLLRAGIILYGIYPSDEVERDVLDIKQALSLHSNIAYIKDVYPGEAIGYGGAYIADRKMKVGTVPVGYGDGYPRELSDKGYVIIRGQKAPILGRICMDQFMVDVSAIEGVQEDDNVILVGKDGELEISVDDISAQSGRFNYEFVCGLNKRIPRVIKRTV